MGKRAENGPFSVYSASLYNRPQANWQLFAQRTLTTAKPIR